MDTWNKEKRSEVMSRIRSTNTKPEIKLRKILFSKGYRYRINYKKLPGKPDIVLPKYKTVIFVHGCFWHGHIGCRRSNNPKSNQEYWEKKIQNNIIRNTKQIEELETLGWKVFIAWECEINNKQKYDDLITRIESFILDK